MARRSPARICSSGAAPRAAALSTSPPQLVESAHQRLSLGRRLSRLNGSEVGQAVPLGGLGGGSPVDWTTSLAQGQNQPYVWMAGYGIADENHFGLHSWMLDVDTDCEQAFDDGRGHRGLS